MNRNEVRLPWEIGKKPSKVLVVGDLILDEYIDGSVKRVSPEAPVPVHHVQKSTYTAGGAGNVARNVKLSGGEVSIVGVCGNDQAGKQMKEILAKDDIETNLIIEDSNRSTTRKTRIRASNQQLLRVDWEKVEPVSNAIQEKIVDIINSSDCQCILLSDYGKGTLPDTLIKKIVTAANSRGIPTVVDPKGTDFEKYSGCDFITPNRSEACEPLGIDSTLKIEPQEIAKGLQEKFNLNAVLVTLGAEGMHFQPKPKSTDEPIKMPTLAREVFDVSGAGDTVAAMFALCVAAQSDIHEAMKIATISAGIVVEKLGTRPVYRSEIIESIGSSNSQVNTSDCRRKIASTSSNLATKVKNWQEQGLKVVFTNGCFDILHSGHVSYLEKARALGDRLVVAVNSDRSVGEIKGPKRPINNENDRCHILSALGFVDAVIIFDQPTPLDIIQTLSPDYLVKGSDWNESEIVGGDFVKSKGGEVKTIDLVEGRSTSNVIDRILDAGK